MALAGVLAVAATDTSLRLPGTALKFGLPIERLASFGTFVPASASAAGGARKSADFVEREGPIRFFGLVARARLAFAEQRLSAGHFEVDGVSPHSLAYVEDQLRRLGYRRQCTRLDATGRQCDWIGRTTLRLQVTGQSLKADIVPPTDTPVATEPPAEPVTVAALDSTRREPARPSSPAATTPAAGAQPETLRLSGSDSLPAPIVIEICRPVRPEEARREGIFGRVTMQILVDTDGRVLDAQIVRGIPALDATAIACARRFRYQPYLWQGRPVRFTYELTLIFVLD